MSCCAPSRMLRLMVGLALACCAATLQATEPRSPLVVHATLNDSGAPTIFAGWPLLLGVGLANTGAEPARLAPLDGTWPQQVRVTLARDGAAAVSLPFTLTAEPPDGALTLPPRSQTDFLMLLPGAATSALAPGRYAVTVTYAIADGAGWTGTSSTGLHLEVAAPAPPDDAQRLELALLEATAHGAKGEYDAARARLNAYLQDEPRAIPALTLMAEILETAAKPELALLYVAAALDEYATSMAATATEPPARLLALRHRLWQQAPELAPWNPANLSPGSEAAAEVAPAAEPATVERVTPAQPAPGAAGHAEPPPAPVTTTAAGTLVPQDEIVEQDILDDPRGQWATAAVASTEYRPEDYSARQAVGAPDVPGYGDRPQAWTPSASERQPEWLQLTYARPVHATEVRVRQTFNPGTIVRVEAISADGSALPLWEGRDTNVYPAERIAWFVVRFPATAEPVASIRIVLDTPAAKGWKQIDAVQLVGE